MFYNYKTYHIFSVRVPACISPFVCGCTCPFASLPGPCAVVGSLLKKKKKPRTVRPRLGVHRLFVKIQTDHEQLAAPATRDRVS